MVALNALFDILLSAGLLGSVFNKPIDDFDRQRESHADEHKYLDDLSNEQRRVFLEHTESGAGNESARVLANDTKLAEKARLLVLDTLKVNNASDSVLQFVDELGKQAQTLLRGIEGDEQHGLAALKPILDKFKELGAADEKFLDKAFGKVLHTLKSPETRALIEATPIVDEPESGEVKSSKGKSKDQEPSSSSVLTTSTAMLMAFAALLISH